MKLIENIKYGLRQWLEIDNEIHQPIKNSYNQSNVYQRYLKHEAWAIGDSSILFNVYKSLPDEYKYSFWKAVPDLPLCKRHSGIPKVILNSIINIIAENYDGITFDNKAKEEEIWNKIDTDNNFYKIMLKAVRDALTFGEGAFKIMYIPDISEYPIIEFVPAKACDIDIKYGRLIEIEFFNNIYTVKDKKYILKETYKKGEIEYKLFDEYEKEVPLNTVPQTSELENVIFADKNYIAAVPFSIYESDKYENHGESIFETKEDIFDAIDEVFSQSIQTVRLAQPNKYVPEDMFEYDPDTGKRKVNKSIFNPIYTKSSNPLSDDSKIELVQASLNSDEYGKTLSQLIVLACSGILSPSTMAIALQNTSLISNDSGEAQREKEKQTLYTINKIKNSLYNTIPEVIVAALKLNAFINNKNCDITKNDINIQFSEYANPSFESQLETLRKAVPSNYVLLSTEKIVDELYGYTLDEKEKAKEVEKLNILNNGVKTVDDILIKQENEAKNTEIIQENKTENINNEEVIK